MSRTSEDRIEHLLASYTQGPDRRFTTPYLDTLLGP